MSFIDPNHNSTEIFILPYHLSKINKLMPTGFKLDIDSPGYSFNFKDSQNKPHKRYHREKLKENLSSE